MRVACDWKSDFSMGESLIEAGAIGKLAKEAGWEAALLADTMTVSGAPAFMSGCAKAGVKGILGVRLRIVEGPLVDPNTGKARKLRVSCQPKLIAKTEEGLRIIMRLLSIANDDTDGHFYYTSRLTWDDVFAALTDAEGHVAASLSTLYSVLRRDDATVIAQKLVASLCAADVFCELVPADSAIWDRQVECALEVAKASGCSLLLSRPTLYPSTDMAETLEVMASIVSNVKRTGLEFRAFIQDYVPVTPTKLITDAALSRARIPSLEGDHIRQAVDGWNHLANTCDLTWSKWSISLPTMAQDENHALKVEAVAGLRRRLGETVFGAKINPADFNVYSQRLVYEIGVIEQMGFAGYFLLTQNIIRWSKANKIAVGTGRGSIGGSLLAYVLDITDIDPIRFGLIFERFINPERLNLPDADLDFMSTRRHEVIEYMAATWGEDRVAGISNYITLQAPSALQNAGRILGLSELETGVSKLVPKVHGSPVSLEKAVEEVPQIAGFAQKHAGVWQQARHLEGRMKSLGQHASGIVVAGEPLVNRAVVERRKGGRTVNWDMDAVEGMGLVKLDVLGVAALDTIAIAVENIKARHGIDVDMSTVPLDDQKVLDLFAKGQTVGSFQFAGAGMRRLLKDLGRGGKLTFNDLVAANALFRPGPMDSGLLEDYVRIKQGKQAPAYPHPKTEEALKETSGVLVYQEQVQKVAVVLSGFTMAEADLLRRAIGKKKPEEMKAMEGRFIGGATAGMVEVELDDGRMVKLHRLDKVRVKGSKERFTIEEIFTRGLEPEL